ncbi:hypothetical protein NI18_21685 [Sphingomonas sp. Ant20]|nr:hypothetical protein NI18_21685 [Sphingomonas sp. Ant20]
MPRRHILSARQRSALLDLPTDAASLLRHYILADDDLIHIDRRRRPENRIGFALQLCALRYPGRMLAPGEVIPLAVCAFLGTQLGIATTRSSVTPFVARRASSTWRCCAGPTVTGHFPVRVRRHAHSITGCLPKPSRPARTTISPDGSSSGAVTP